ncbi:RING-type E3 ubiquitin transferase [Ranunculus cassubicifolius]
MAVYYKFKSAKDFDSVPIDGHFISVATLKEKIFETKHLGRGTDFDLMVSNAQTNEEYPDEDMLIPKNTSVLVRRVPGRPRKPIVTGGEETKALEKEEHESQPAKSNFSAATFPEDNEWDEFGNDLYAIPDVPPVQSINPVQEAPPSNRADEDSKIKALIDTPSLDWQQQVQDGFGGGRGFGRGLGGRMMGGRGFGRGGGILERKTPPPGYICHRCKVPGHFIQHCPTNGDPNYDVKRTKPPTGIPKSMLVPTTDGSYALPNGSVAVMRPNEAAFEKEIEGLPSTRSITDIPPELRCPLCKEVMQDAVLTSKCCFKSFCDKCIRNHIISKSACVCGATNVLADDLLPNRTVRETINRFLESTNSSADNAGSMFQVQDMESSRPVQHKVPSPTLSATSKGDQTAVQPTQSIAAAPAFSASSKGEQLPPTQKDETSNIRETANEANDTGAQSLPLGIGMTTKAVDASEATFESMTVKEPPSQVGAFLAEEEVQQKSSVSEPGKKKKKKKVRMPPNDLQWRTPQDMAAENFMMPYPQACDPYWGNMPFGMDGYMNPYNGGMPYNMGYVPGPFDMPMGMGGMPPLDPFGGQGYMMPPVPPQREFQDFPMGPNGPPPNGPPSMMSRAEFEARKADARRRGIEGRGERVGSKDVSSNGNIPPMKSKQRMMPPNESPDHHYHHHRGERERESSLDGPPPPRHRVEREPNMDLVHHHPDRLPHYPHHHHRPSRYHGDEREISPEQRAHHHQRHHRRAESPSRDPEYSRHIKRRPSDHHDLPPPFEPPVRKRRPIEEPVDDVVMENIDTDKKQKKSVFARISFPDENKKRKASTTSSSKAGLEDVNNGYKANLVNGGTKKEEVKLSSIREIVEDDYESSDDERHFKRRPSRYEPPPPQPAEWEENVRPSRSSRERGHKHR